MAKCEYTDGTGQRCDNEATNFFRVGGPTCDTHVEAVKYLGEQLRDAEEKLFDKYTQEISNAVQAIYNDLSIIVSDSEIDAPKGTEHVGMVMTMSAAYYVFLHESFNLRKTLEQIGYKKERLDLIEKTAREAIYSIAGKHGE